MSNTFNRKEIVLSSFQWFIFLVANAIAMPIVLGSIFSFPQHEIATLLQRTFFVVGVSSFIQGKWGHRLPIADGPAGSWVTVFVIFASITFQEGGDMRSTLPLLEGGMIISGIILLFLRIPVLLKKLLKLFTSLVTGSFLIILAVQLSGIFIKGMIVRSEGSDDLNVMSTCLAFFVFFLVFFLSIKGRGWMRTYAVIIGILGGWILDILLKKGMNPTYEPAAVFSFPELFAWGLPQVNGPIFITSVLFTLLLIANTIAAVSSMVTLYPDRKMEAIALRKGVSAGGVSHVISSMFSSIGVVTLPVSTGFVQITKQTRILPFLLGAAMLVIVSLFPSVVGILSTLPVSIASGALLSTIVGMFGIGLKTISSEEPDQRRVTIIGLSLMFGIGVMHLGEEVFRAFPIGAQYLLKNGLLVGTIVAIVLDQVWKEEVKTQKKKQDVRKRAHTG